MTRHGYSASLVHGDPPSLLAALKADPPKALVMDLSRAPARGMDLAVGLPNGLVDYKIASVDRTWSGLIFARRSGGG